MPSPAFFASAPSLTLFDPLSRFLGAGDGILTYGYEDAVKLAGHSCPTVAGSWLMLVTGIASLWPGEIPERGKIEVHLPDAADEGTTGVVAAVASLLTGARGEDGFKGIAGQFRRQGLLFFETPLAGSLGLRRNDTGQGVIARLDLSSVPVDQTMPLLLNKWRDGSASALEIDQFGKLWQDRVRRLFEQKDRVVGLMPWV